jgi:hypothetical protein
VCEARSEGAEGGRVRDDPESDARAVDLSARKITAVLAARRYDLEIEMLLAVGEACPFGQWREKEIWRRQKPAGDKD